jgi:two-component system phosphate regulon sensor histidine kinase PhoR
MFKSVSNTTWQVISRVTVVLIAGLVIGLMVGHVTAALACALAIYLAFQLRNLLLLDRWLRFRRVLVPPDMSGPWGDVLATISRIYRRKQFHKQRVSRLLREFRRLTSAMPDGAVLLNVDHEILWFNNTAAQWLGLQRKRDVGMRIENLVRHPDFVAYLDSSDRAAPVRIPQAAGQETWFSIYLVQTRSVRQRLLIIRDITREVHIEAMRKDFVANASHELRSPLTVIAGYLDSLTDDPDLGPAWTGPVQEMRRQADRMRTIIQDLLELSRLEGGGLANDDQLVDVGGVLSLLRKEMAGLEHRAAISVQLDTDDCLRGSESELNSVFSNLISNAVKYTPAEGKIHIRWWTDGQGAHVSVKDSGIGIAPEHIPRLTERFYRVDAGRSRKMGGSGLGLAIVKHALQRHDATLTVESEEGMGSTFTCHFPLNRVVTRTQRATP